MERKGGKGGEKKGRGMEVRQSGGGKEKVGKGARSGWEGGGWSRHERRVSQRMDGRAFPITPFNFQIECPHT